MAEVIDPALAATAGKPCDLGQDPSKYLERFEKRYEHTSLLADSIGIKDKPQKLRLTLLWGGQDFRQLAQNAGVVHTGENADTLENAIDKVREACKKHVTFQWPCTNSCTPNKVQNQSQNSQRNPISLQPSANLTRIRTQKDEQKNDALIFGTSDEELRQEALAKDFDYNALIKAALGYEQSRKASGTINSTDEVRQLTHTQDEVDDIVARVIAGEIQSPQT